MKAVEFVLDIIFPKICQSCGAEGRYLCTACLARVEEPLMFCPECDHPSTLGITHPACEKRTSPLKALLVASKYEDAGVRTLLWQLKYFSARAAALDLSLLLLDFLAKQDLLDFFSTFSVTAVPLHRKRLRLRGFNQAELLARLLAEKLSLPYRPYLVKTKKTPRQVDLEKEERVLNVINAFALGYPIQPAGKILLIDDVATTGSTLAECANILKQSGAEQVWALVVARNKT